MHSSKVNFLPDQVTRVRDGTRLLSNIWLPGGRETAPVILCRTPYSNAPSEYERYGLDRYVDAGFAVVFQAVRGRPPSDGEFGFFFVEAEDGFDTIQWIAAQSWCNGNVGMDGGSYLGTVQWLAARERPSPLKCIVPTAPAGDYFNELPYLGGALHLGGSLVWFASLDGTAVDFSDRGEKNLESLRPLSNADEILGMDLPIYRDILCHPTSDEYWERIQFRDDDFNKIDIPSLTVTGWFDGDQPGALHYWHGLQNSDCPIRNQSRLIIGPWNHKQCYLGGERSFNEFSFPDNVFFPLQQARLAFFDCWLNENSALLDELPRVQIYVTGINEWRGYDEFPPLDYGEKSLYLSSDGHANSRNGDGRLLWDRPDTQQTDHFSYDPIDPIPYRQSGEDLQELELREDMLVYTSDPMLGPLEIIGPVSLDLIAASDAIDTDFVARLVDVHPDGRAVNLTHTQGVIRARYRNGNWFPEFLLPDRPERYRIRLMNLGHAFMTGHRIRLEVMSSCFPLIDPNTNTGDDPASDTGCRIATQSVHHGPMHASRLLLPVKEIDIEGRQFETQSK